MNRQEISEIRRRLNPDKNSIDCILGCYVDEKGEIISSFRRAEGQGARGLNYIPNDSANRRNPGEPSSNLRAAVGFFVRGMRSSPRDGVELGLLTVVQ